MEGFFSDSELMMVQEPIPRQAQCGKCGLFKGCVTPKMKLYGRGKKKIFVLGEAPGEQEDRLGKPFVGKAGERLQKDMRTVGIDLFEDCWVYNSLICFTGDTIVKSPSKICKIYRRKYSGPVFTVHTLSGRVFTGTPNHPVLTPDGWIPLGLLKKGDNLLRSSYIKRPGFSRPNVNYPPTKFSELFNTLSQFGRVERVVGGRVDFHGDGEDGDVDVVVSDSLLGRRTQTTTGEHEEQTILVPTDEGKGGLFCFCHSDTIPLTSGSFSTSDRGVGSFGQCSATNNTFARHTNSARIASRANGFTKPDEKYFELGKFETIRMCNSLKSFPKTVAADRVVNFKTIPFDKISSRRNTTTRPTASMESADNYTPVDKRLPEATPSCSEFVRQFLNSESAGAVVTDRIINIEVQFDAWSPRHVYNLETEEGYYLADGIIVSNCHPPRNRIKKEEAVDWCRPNVIQAIEQTNPETIILLGNKPLRSIIGMFWKEELYGIKRWAGFRIPLRKWNAWCFPTYHPSHLERGGNDEDEDWNGQPDPVKDSQFLAHLRYATKRRGRPFPDGPPDYGSMVQIILDPKAAAQAIDQFHDSKIISFDYETTTLKPDGPSAQIVSCSISDGNRTIAYPWYDQAIQTTSQLLVDPNVSKIGWNIKFEERWTRAHLGKRVRGWKFDGMLAAHCLDARRGITSVKFNAFSRLGMEDYAAHISPFLEAKPKSGNNPNRIRDIEIGLLLKYNGLDSLLEYIICRQQAKELGVEL